jgi:hypothetical protein
MPGTNESQRVASESRNVYDVRGEMRLNSIETRVTAVEVDVAVTQANCSTKDDMQSLRAEMHSGHDRIIRTLYEHKLEFQETLARQRDDLNKGMMAHMWKLYGFASLMLGGVYFIARYVN